MVRPVPRGLRIAVARSRGPGGSATTNRTVVPGEINVGGSRSASQSRRRCARGGANHRATRWVHGGIRVGDGDGAGRHTRARRGPPGEVQRRVEAPEVGEAGREAAERAVVARARVPRRSRPRRRGRGRRHVLEVGAVVCHGDVDLADRSARPTRSGSIAASHAPICAGAEFSRRRTNTVRAAGTSSTTSGWPARDGTGVTGHVVLGQLDEPAARAVRQQATGAP